MGEVVVVTGASAGVGLLARGREGPDAVRREVEAGGGRALAAGLRSR